VFGAAAPTRPLDRPHATGYFPLKEKEIGQLEDRGGAMRLTDSRQFWARAVRRSGGAPPALRFLLAPAALAYGFAMRLRREAYREGTFQVRKLGAPVISVGNVTVGGTGKTPMVQWIARWCLRTGRKPAILSRGYGAREIGPAGKKNDEALLLDRDLPQTPHYADPDRVAAGLKALAAGADCLLLDDGFQHLRIHRDLNLVLVDALDPFGGGRVLPAGALREPLGCLEDADAIVLTRADALGHGALEKVRQEVRTLVRGTPIIEAAHRPVALTLTTGARAEPVEWLSGRRVFVFCGLGNPDAFLHTTSKLGAEIAGAHFFPDHFAYRERNLSALAEECVENRADCALTTEKDAVKIGAWPGMAPLRVLKVEIELTAGQAQLESLLKAVCS
jgi:tetraacyldisaccharide 4'-kinase